MEPMGRIGQINRIGNGLSRSTGLCQPPPRPPINMNFRAIAQSLVVTAAALLFALPTEAQTVQPQTTTPRHLPAGELNATDTDDCGCRNIPGGHPCQGGCPKCMQGVDCIDGCGAEARWTDMRPMDFGGYGPGGYAGPSRFAHLSDYRLRPGDNIQLVYLITRRQETGEYKLTPGDEVLIESVTDDDLNRGSLENGLKVQPDGSITVRLLGQVHAAGLTVEQLREVLKEQYAKYYEEPAIDVTPVKTNTLAEDIRNAVGGQSGFNQQAITVVVMPDGKIRLPGIGEICVQSFTLSQLKREINYRYNEIVVGIDVDPASTPLCSRAGRGRHT